MNMRRLTWHTGFIAILGGSLILPARAQLNLPNALIEPVRRKPEIPLPSEVDGYGRIQTGLPPVSMPPLGSTGNTSEQAAKLEENGQEVTLASVRNAFAGFQVTAIVGNVAILRRTVAQTGVQAAGVPAMTNGQLALPAAAGTASNAVGSSGQPTRNESLTLKNGEQFDFMASTGTYVPVIGNGRVVVYYDRAGSARKPGKRTAVFIGELDVVTIVARPIVLQTKDAELKASLRVQAGTPVGNTSSNSSPLPSSPTTLLPAP